MKDLKIFYQTKPICVPAIVKRKDGLCEVIRGVVIESGEHSQRKYKIMLLNNIPIDEKNVPILAEVFKREKYFEREDEAKKAADNYIKDVAKLVEEKRKEYLLSTLK